jgi:hypothetical protein
VLAALLGWLTVLALSMANTVSLVKGVACPVGSGPSTGLFTETDTDLRAAPWDTASSGRDSSGPAGPGVPEWH